MHPTTDRVRDTFIGQVLASAYHPGVSYRIEHKLGEGGTAAAYLAKRQAGDGQWPVVVKIILPQLVADSDDRALTIIKKEAVALGRLNERVPPTPFVVRLLDTGSVGFRTFNRVLELPWIAIEYVHGGVEGSTLEERVLYSTRETGFAFDPPRAARAIQALAKGLDEIHEVGVVHRDLSPGNVLCCGAGESEMFKISDFGIARPLGVAATFGNAFVGTPGYIAPEQFAPDGVLSKSSDIFSFAAIVFFLLTGEQLFDIRSPGQAIVAARSPVRRSVLEVPTLAYELREREAACQAIDLAISRATAQNPADRPSGAKLFADSLLPWVSRDATSRPSRRWVSSLDNLASREMVLETNWMVRHPPGDDRLIVNVAWNAAGNAMAVATRGLCFWDGTRWLDVPAGGLPPPEQLRFVRRLGAAAWLVGTDGARLFEYSREGVRELLRGSDRSVSFTDATTDLDDVAVVLGERAGSPPLLHALVGKRWLKPLPVRDAASISGLSRIDDERWLIVGRALDGQGYAALYRPLAWETERLPTPPTRALLACAGRPERRQATAVGIDGATLTVDETSVVPGTIPARPDLLAIAVDTLGRHWAAGRGRVWSRRVAGDWVAVWEHAAWQPPFVGIMAEVGVILAVTVDGAVLECRSIMLDKTTPAF